VHFTNSEIAQARERGGVPRGVAATFLGVSTMAVRYMEKKGRLNPEVRLDGARIFKLEELEAVRTVRATRASQQPRPPPGMKRCRWCAAVKPDDNFYKRKRGQAETGMGCKPCVRAHINNRRTKLRVLAQELKSRPCADCRGTFPSECMDFDHVRGTKINSVARLSMMSDRFFGEIEKCELVCANCHRIRTAQRIRSRQQEKVRNGLHRFADVPDRSVG